MDLIIAAFVDLIIGDPYNFPHPVKLMGKLISCEEGIVRSLSKNRRHFLWGGLLIVLLNIFLAFAIPYIILLVLKPYPLLYAIINIYLLYTCIAARCLHYEGMKIYRAIDKGIEEARYRLSFIVGRDTNKLNESEIVRATVETVAENTSDGVIAPILFAIIGGAPLAMAYKMVNTMDSMLGYMNEKYRDIGYFPAKTDDLFNYIPARITGILMNIASILRFNVIDGFVIMVRDRKNHKSPNCAYPEGAVAGLLGIQLGGDNYYFGEIVKKPRIGDKTRELDKKDIKRAIEIMYRSEGLLLIVYFLVNLL